MNAYIANTDYDWYKYLSSKKDLDEANFWRPTSGAHLAKLSPGEPLFFKLKQAYGNMIVGFGLFVMYRPIKFGEAPQLESRNWMYLAYISYIFACPHIFNLENIMVQLMEKG